MKQNNSVAISCILAFCGSVVLSPASFAQTPPTGQERLGPEASRPDLPELGPIEMVPFALPPVPDRPTGREGQRDGRTIQVDQIAIRGSTVFGQDKLAEVAQDFVGRPVTVDELLTLRDLLTSLYVENGYVNSGAVIPDQRVGDGVFTIVVVEGQLSELVVSDLDALDMSFIEDRIRLAAEKPLNIEKLQERIQLLLTDPAIHKINAALGPGQRLGESRLDLKIEEAPNHEIEVEVANDRSPSVGAERASTTYRVRNVTGHSDPLTAEIGLAEGLNDYSISYSTPVTPDDARVFASASYSSSDVVEEPFNAIDVESESWSLTLGVSQPIVKTLDDEVSFDTSFERKRSTTNLLGRRFSFSEGVRNGRSNVTALRFTQQWQHRERDEALALRSTESFGLGLLGATRNEGEVPDGQFFTWLGQVQYAKRLPWVDWQLALRGDVQLTPVGLLPIERIAIGGATTVRGYRENQLVTDNGWVASAELRIPLVQLEIPGVSEEPGDGQLSLVPFVDVGGGWNEETPDPDNELLLSAGGGLRWQVSRDLDLRLDIGVPIRDVPEPDDDDLQDLGIHFGLRARFSEE